MSAPEPANNLANLILMLLTPMFLWSTEGDVRLAYAAAAQTVNEYRIANRLSLFTVAKIIAFDIATLSSLSQSMYEDVSVLLALRLRGNATSLDRSGERNRRALEQQERTSGRAFRGGICRVPLGSFGPSSQVLAGGSGSDRNRHDRRKGCRKGCGRGPSIRGPARR